MYRSLIWKIFHLIYGIFSFNSEQILATESLMRGSRQSRKSRNLTICISTVVVTSNRMQL